jgi:cytochrome c-type biogenesis protein CcmH/NrfG
MATARPARRRLNTLLAADPKDEDALVALGESRLAAAGRSGGSAPPAFAQAGKLFARAFKIDPDNPETLHGYADSQAWSRMTESMVESALGRWSGAAGRPPAAGRRPRP